LTKFLLQFNFPNKISNKANAKDEYRKSIAGSYIAVITIGKINFVIWPEEVSFQIP
jgi:hypothetical protein